MRQNKLLSEVEYSTLTMFGLASLVCLARVLNTTVHIRRISERIQTKVEGNGCSLLYGITLSNICGRTDAGYKQTAEQQKSGGKMESEA